MDYIDFDENYLICECNCVSLQEINDFVKIHGFDLEELMRQTNLGNACKSCLKDVEFWKTKLDININM